MKLLKTLFLIMVTFIFSGCYFLDYVIPEEYFAEEGYYYEEESQFDYKSPYVWISHPVGIQCGGKYFISLEEAEEYLNNIGISTYDSYKKKSSQRNKCGFPTELRYYFEIMYYDVNTAISFGWSSSCRKIKRKGKSFYNKYHTINYTQ